MNGLKNTKKTYGLLEPNSPPFQKTETHFGTRIGLRLHPGNINRDNGIEIPEACMPTIKQHNSLISTKADAEGTISNQQEPQRGSKRTNQHQPRYYLYCFANSRNVAIHIYVTQLWHKRLNSAIKPKIVNCNRSLTDKVSTILTESPSKLLFFFRYSFETQDQLRARGDENFNTKCKRKKIKEWVS